MVSKINQGMENISCKTDDTRALETYREVKTTFIILFKKIVLQDFPTIMESMEARKLEKNVVSIKKFKNSKCDNSNVLNPVKSTQNSANQNYSEPVVEKSYPHYQRMSCRYICQQQMFNKKNMKETEKESNEQRATKEQIYKKGKKEEKEKKWKFSSKKKIYDKQQYINEINSVNIFDVLREPQTKENEDSQFLATDVTKKDSQSLQKYKSPKHRKRKLIRIYLSVIVKSSHKSKPYNLIKTSIGRCNKCNVTHAPYMKFCKWAERKIVSSTYCKSDILIDNKIRKNIEERIKHIEGNMEPNNGTKKDDRYVSKMYKPLNKENDTNHVTTQHFNKYLLSLLKMGQTLSMLMHAQLQEISKLLLCVRN